jgi:DNA-binding NarL/FixJ family response regulator
MTLRIVLVDDHPLFRQGLRAAVQSRAEMTVVGEAADARAALAVVEATEPDVVVADVSLPGSSGIVFARDLAQRAPRSKVLMLTMHARTELAREALDAGARGYALKSELPEAILDAIDAVGHGRVYLTPHIPQAAVDALKSGGSHPLAGLSQREREVFDLVVLGHSNENVAQELCISVKTVQTHRARINQKLAVHSTAELVRFAARRGLLAE